MSETLECQQLAPFKACGLAGSCEGNQTQQHCECAPGWESSEEMNLYFLSREDLADGIGICNFNYDILLILYILVLISGLGALGLQVYMIRTKAQLKRVIPLLIGLTLQSLLAIYRLARFYDALTGKDVFFSFLVSNAAFFDWFDVNIFINKYFHYIAKKAKFELESSMHKFRRHQRMNSMALVLELILYQISWTTILISDQQTTGRIMLKIKFGLLALRAVYLVWTIHLLFNSFIKDIETLLHLIESRDNQVLSVSSNQKKKHKFIAEVLLPQTVRLKKDITIVTGAFSMFLLVCAVWDYAFVFYGYLFPLNFISWNILVIVVSWFRLIKKKSKLKQNNSQTPDTSQKITTATRTSRIV